MSDAKPLTFNRLRVANVQRCNDIYQPLESWTLSDYGTILGGETGEALNLLKKIRRTGDAEEAFFKAKLDKRIGQLADELADVVVAADLLAARAGINLGEAIVNKFNQKSKDKGSEVML